MNRMSISKKYYLTGLWVIVLLPVVIVALYEWLAGGMLNGIAGSWHRAIVNPNVFLLFINPVLLLSGYALLIYFFRKYKKQKNSTLNSLFVYVILAVATVVVFVGVFWKALTT